MFNTYKSNANSFRQKVTLAFSKQIGYNTVTTSEKAETGGWAFEEANVTNLALRFSYFFIERADDGCGCVSLGGSKRGLRPGGYAEIGRTGRTVERGRGGTGNSAARRSGRAALSRNPGSGCLCEWRFHFFPVGCLRRQPDYISSHQHHSESAAAGYSGDLGQ
ncbi:hypothetical protein SDC9_100622 [bioreactor metagenome]|uniref:Uncharacterized protein n=1 Tax=bioreactor metagenome TaxID=1076179 RepID=A0A645AKV0_9ZZZZ